MIHRMVLTLMVAALLSACGITPWVKPYERSHLSDPIMSFDRDPISSAYRTHLYDAREGARGGNGGKGGGGCGCN